MTSVEVGDDGFVVAAEIIAEAFSIAASTVQGLMQTDEITSRCEKGVDEDEGRWRLTFIHKGRAFRLTIDKESKILSQARFDAPRHAKPLS
ncbi:DUF6522 family protein [Phaeobacter marinintestinus]|uniref:DUF6522 family protein n=1 Tax=Falsiphaeobacter marinintestinus TaxID=1492905 RepID=UPI0011B6A546|nr:DUF6522 family protein [Phaeobacter marinintestinus]